MSNAINQERMQRMRAALEAALSPTELNIQDDSHLHAGHAGAATGLGHFTVHVTSTIFAGLNRIQQHQKIYAALGTMMQTDIHALSIRCGVPPDSD